MEPFSSTNQFEIEAPKAKILVVDDNADVVQSIVAVLESLGEEILTATNANDALKHLLKCEPAVMVLDVMMPEVDGLQLASMIRQRERFRHTPIIFLTGLGQEDRQMLQAYQVGAADYLLKPCDPDVLRYKVKIFVDLAKKNEMLRLYTHAIQQNSAKLEDALTTTLKAKAELEREIEERKRAEVTRDRLAGQLGATPDFAAAMAEGAVTLSREGTILYCNGRFGEMVERDCSELLGLPGAACIAPHFLEGFQSLLQDAWKGRVTAEIELQCRNGSYVPVQATLNAFRTSEIEAVAMVVTDLRDQKRNEQMMAEGRLARVLLEHSQPAMAVCDSSGRIILASNAVRQLCGNSVLLRNFDEVLPLHLVHEQGRAFSVAEVLSGAIHKTTDVELTNGKTVPLMMSASPIVTEVDGTLGCIITLVDISERKVIEETLRRNEKLAAVGRLAGALAHEVNNPLAAVTNLIFLLQHHSGIDETARAFVEQASAELSRVSHIVRATLSFYRESARPVEVRPAELADNVLDIYIRQIADRSIQIHRDYEFDGVIQSFPGELRQVLLNIIGNALDAAPANGKVALRIRTARHWRTGAAGVSVSVADDGPGIPPKYRDKLFEPFFTTKGEKGTGLGLWVTRGIVEKQGGAIRVRSNVTPERHGTVFSVFLPALSASFEHPVISPEFDVFNAVA
jgi:PAS domain S-box-containing protein